MLSAKWLMRSINHFVILLLILILGIMALLLKITMMRFIHIKLIFVQLCTFIISIVRIILAIGVGILAL